MIHSSPKLFDVLYDVRDRFAKFVGQQFPVFSSWTSLDFQLSTVNMKCIQQDDGVLNIVITDLCANIATLYHLCNKAELDLFATLQS